MKLFLRSRRALLCALFSLFTVFGFSAGHTVSFNNINNVYCNSSCMGSAHAVVTGGTGPFVYAWAPGGGTSATASNLCAGTYTCTVTDMNDGSIATGTVQITQPAAITISVTNIVPATCGFPNGSISINVSGGNAPYTYNWLPSGSTTANVTNLTGGTYTVAVTDANGCVSTQAISVPNLNGPSASIMFVPPICSGQTAQLIANVAGISPFNYNWSPSGSLSQPNIATPVASPTVTTTYTLTVVDGNGCTTNATVTIIVNPGFQSSISVTPATCNQANGDASATIISGGTAPFTYSWSNSATTSSISNLAAGSYSLTITDAGGCTNTGVANVPNNGGPTVTTSSTPLPCANNLNGVAVAAATGNAPPFTYTWLTTPQVVNDTINSLAPGTYTVQVTDNAGCISYAQATVTQAAPSLFMYASPVGMANCNTPTGQAISMVQGGTPPYTYLWSNGATTNNLSGVMAGSYSLTVSDAGGCSASGNVNINSTCGNIITGRAYYDINGNCQQDMGELGVSGAFVSATPGPAYVTTNSTGDYSLYVWQPGTFTVTCTTPQNPYYTTGCPVSGSHAVTFALVGDTTTGIDFGRQPIVQNVQDLTVSMTTGAARPGFQQWYYISYQNVGTVAMSDTLFFGHDSILSNIYSIPLMDGYTHPTGYWLYNLQPGQGGTIVISLTVPTIQNGGYLGRQLVSNVRIEPIATDSTPNNNGDDEIDIITASWDPNFKAVWAPGINNFGDILPTDTLLAYTIGFQNTGTDTAFTVVVKDTLPAQLDVSTLQPGASSHPYTMSLQTLQSGQHEVTFSFFNILLPDSFVNEPASHGEVKFRIKRMPGLPVGTVITNTAHNYFDFNPPVATNTLNTMIVQPLGTTGITAAAGISVAPNPFNETTTIRFDKTQEFELELFDLSGRRVLRSGKQNGNSYVIKRSGLESGVYLCRITGAGQPVRTLKIVIR